MKIIQINIWYGKLGYQIMDFLQAKNPDFVCMQEVNDLRGRASGNFFATLDEIKAATGLRHAFMSPTNSLRYMEREMRFGNAILSKLPLSATESIFTHGSFVANFDVLKDDSNTRNLQHVTVEVNGQSLHILNYHGYHIHGSKTGNEETLRQVQIIAKTISSLKGPIILCGDFNLVPDSQSIAILNDKLRNLSVENGLKRTYTQLSNVEGVCDYIFVNDQVNVQHFEMSEALISDHKALILEFDL